MPFAANERMVKRSLADADERREFEKMIVEFLRLGEVTIVRQTAEPGWRWSEHVRPVAGTEWCQVHHRGIVVSGRLRIRTIAGEELEFGAGDVYEVPPGHDGWVVGDEATVLIELSASILDFGRPPAGERVLTTLLFTDIVGSTSLVQRLGDEGWKHLVAAHNALTRNEVERYRGVIVDRAGDGVFAHFDGAARAVRAARAITSAAARVGLRIRSGVHTGEVELATDGLRGVAIHEAARIMAAADAGETLVSDVTRQLATGSGLAFTDRGEFELRGVEGPRRLYAVTETG
jgi:class 3 adenylate cyclase